MSTARAIRDCLMCGHHLQQVTTNECPACGERIRSGGATSATPRIPITRAEVRAFRLAVRVLMCLWLSYALVALIIRLLLEVDDLWMGIILPYGLIMMCITVGVLVGNCVLAAAAFSMTLGYAGILASLFLLGVVDFGSPIARYASVFVLLVSQIAAIHNGYRMLNVGQRLKIAGLPLTVRPHEVP